MIHENLYVGIALFIFFIIIDVVLYAFSAAIGEVSENTIEDMAEKGDKKAKKLLTIMEHPSKFDRTIDAVELIMNIVAGSYILGSLANTVAREIKSDNILIYIGFGAAMIFILLVAGVLIPSFIGKRKAEKSALRLVGAVRVITTVLSPVLFVTIKFSRLILKIFRINPDKEEDSVTEEEIITMVNEGQEQGVLEAGEAEMINNIFELGVKHAGDIMTHRGSVVAVESDITLDEFIQTHLEGNFSRFPVYEGDIDNIIGTIHIRDALILYRDHIGRKSKIKDIKGLLREPFLVPESRDIDELLKDMQEKKVHMGIVVDEYGQTAGLISMEDIIEEIVGNILDEYDEEENIAEYNGEDSYTVDGLMELEDLNKLLGTHIESTEFDTLNGFLMSKLHRVANENEKEIVEDSGYSFKILEVSNNVVRKVKITFCQTKG